MNAAESPGGATRFERPLAAQVEDRYRLRPLQHGHPPRDVSLRLLEEPLVTRDDFALGQQEIDRCVPHGR
jgi:hypothetical protein